MTRYLYALALPRQVQLRQRGLQARELLAQGILQAGPAAVESISTGAGERTITGRVTGKFAALTATEFEELFAAGGIDVVPYYAPSTEAVRDRYVALSDAETEAAHPTEPRVQRVDGRVTTEGSRQSHFRDVATTITTVDTPFGSGGIAGVGIPATASKVRWYNPDNGSLADATVQSTVTGEHGDVEIYDAGEPSFADPTLVYDLPYADEWPHDVRVWDSRGEASKTATETVDGEDRTAVQWQRVFATDHDYVGVPLLDSDHLRLYLDESNGLSAEQWDTGSSSFGSAALGVSSWELWDATITRIGLERVDAQLRFEDSDNPGTRHSLNVSVKRGYETALVWNPANEGSVPQGLIDLLDPIAYDGDQDPRAVAGITERSEVLR
jgi:hypothetical protein